MQIRNANLTVDLTIPTSARVGTRKRRSTMRSSTLFPHNVAQVWQTAERRLGRPCDPLDPSLVARMKQIGQKG